MVKGLRFRASGLGKGWMPEKEKTQAKDPGTFP